MSQPVRSLEHVDADKKDDAVLRKEARDALANMPAHQLVAELMARLRSLDLPWWTPDKLRLRWPAQDRLRWLRTRADIRQGITSQLTGLAKNAARKKSPDFQASLIDSVIDEGDVTTSIFEEAFDTTDLVLYGPADGFYRAFMDSMPWDQDTAVHQELCAFLLEALLSDKCTTDIVLGGEKERFTRKPILSPIDVRLSIDARVWHTRMPIDVRVAIDEARLKRERDRPNDPFNAAGELSIATPAIIATNIPLRDLMPVMLAAERAMGFGASTGSRPRAESGKSESKADVAPSRTPEPAPASMSSSPARASVKPPPVAEAPAPPQPQEAPPQSVRPQRRESVPPPQQAQAQPSAPPPASVRPPPVEARMKSEMPSWSDPPPKATPSVTPQAKEAKEKRSEQKLERQARGVNISETMNEPSTSTQDELETTNPWITGAQGSDDGFDELDALLPPADSETTRRKKNGKS